MKLLPLAVKNALRNKRRTILTVFGVAFFVGIICFMRTIVTSFDAWSANADPYARVGVMSNTNITINLPRAHEAYLQRLPEVEWVQKMDWFGGKIGDRREDFFANFACDPEIWLEIWEEYKVPPDQYEAWVKNRQGAMVGKMLADKFGWKIGDRVTLTGTIYPVNPELTILAIYEGPDPMTMYFHWEYFNQLAGGEMSVGMYWLKVRDQAAIPGLIAAIDAHFENGADPTKSMTEKEFARMFSSMMGNVGALVGAVGGVAVLIMVLIVGNTMAMAARERARETATMRTLGFTPGPILLMILAESLTVTLAGAAIGVGIPLLLFNVAGLPMGPFFPTFPVAGGTVAAAAIIALCVGVFAGGIPAALNARVNIVEGLRRVG